jgi:hypothetical protein
MWGTLVNIFTWLSAGYVLNDATRTVGQVTDTGDYHQPTAPSGAVVVADVKEKTVIEKVALWVSIIGGIFVVYEFVRKFKK